MLLHLGGGYMQNHFENGGMTTDYDAEKELGLKGATVKKYFPVFRAMCQEPAFGSGSFGCLGQGGLQIIGPAGSGGTNRLSSYENYLQKPTSMANLTWVKSNHTYKFGAEFRTEGYITIPFTGQNGNYAFSQSETGLPAASSLPLSNQPGFAYASFLLGRVDNVTVASPNERTRVGKQLWGFYAQDTWKVTPKLSLDYGLRYDYGTYLKEQYGRAPNLGINVPNPKAGGLLGGVIFEATCNCDFAKNYPYAFGPRFGVAYRINSKTVFRGGWGLVYATTPNTAATSAQYSVISVGSPAPGEPVMILKDGVPSNIYSAWPDFSPGLYPQTAALLSPAPTYIDQNAGRPARQNQWSLGIQREITSNLMVEASYVGNRGAWWPSTLSSLNLITPAILAKRGLSLSNAADVTLLGQRLNSPTAISRGFGTAPFPGFPLTATVAQSLRPYPQFNANIVADAAPVGNTWYDALQVKVTKRTSYGFAATSSFTWSKSMGLGVDAGTNNVLDRASNRSISSFDQPIVWATSLLYTVPKFNINKIASWAIRDWQIGAFLQYGSGLPIAAPAATNALNTILFQSTYANRVAGQPLFLVDPNSKFDPNTKFMLNPVAWTQPAAGQFGSGSVYYSDYRQRRRPNESMNLGRVFRFNERVNMQIRMEFTNVFNRLVLATPSSTNSGAPQTRNSAGKPTSGFGWVNTTAPGRPREGTLVARITF